MNVVCGCEIRADANNVGGVPVVGIAVVVDIAGVGSRLHVQNRDYPTILVFQGFKETVVGLPQSLYNIKQGLNF